MNARRLWTVASLELTQRRRTSRWPIVLGVWFAVIALVATLSWRALHDSGLSEGPGLYDVTTFFVLMLAMLVVPSLTATTVNGDREQGVLATLQTTLVTSWELVLGKLLASWVISLVFLATALPFLAWAWAAGGIGAGAILRSLLVLVVVMAVVAAIGLMFSTLTARPVASAVLTYLTLAVLVVGTLIAFLIAAVALTESRTVTVHGVPPTYYEPRGDGEDEPPQPTPADCTTYREQVEVTHTERIWPLLAVNPFVVVADAAPSRPLESQDELFGGFTPLRWISEGARQARAGAPTEDEVRDTCAMETARTPEEAEAASRAERVRENERANQVVWPYGLTLLGLIGAGSVVIAERRVRTPVRRLPSGTRIA